MIFILFFTFVAASADQVMQDGIGLKLEHISDSSIIRELIQRVEFLEARDKRHVESIGDLNQKVTTLQNEITVLHKKNEAQDQLISTLMHHLWKPAEIPTPSDKPADDVAIPNETKENTTRHEKSRQMRRKDNLGIQRRENEVTVAFTAGLTHTQLHMGAHQNIIFDHVETNIGNGYNSHHGVFTAPVSGIYLLFVSALADTYREIWCQIVVNGNIKATAYARGTDQHHDQASQAIIVQLQSGDDVAVQNAVPDDAVYGDSYIYTTFSGFLVQGYPQSGSVVG